jgi:hypothetical protein
MGINQSLTHNKNIMKTLKTMMALALIAVCGFASASPKTNDGSATKQSVVDTYLNAVVHGNMNGIGNAIDDNAHFYIERGVRVQTTDKRQVLDNLKATANIDQNCECSSTVLKEGDTFLVEKVEMKYNEVTRTDVITAQLSDDGWKITKVETSYK